MELKDAVKVIESKIEATNTRFAEAVETVKSESARIQKESDAKVEELKLLVTKKDGEILDIVNEVKEIKAKAGRVQELDQKATSWANLIAKSLDDRKAELYQMGMQQSGEIKPIELKNISTSTLTTNIITYLPDRAGLEPTGQTRFRDLVRVINSDTDNVQYPRANAPVGTGSFSRVTEGATKPQVERGYTMVTLNLKPMAGYAIASRQSLRNITFLREWLPVSLLEQLMDSEDLDFANALVAAATQQGTISGVTVSVEKLIEYIRILMQLKFAPTAIVTDPAVWSEIVRTKPNDYSVPLVVTVDNNGTVRVMGRPLYPVNWLTGRRVIVGDWTKAAIVQSEGLTLRQSDSHGNTFITNETTFLLERTEGLAIFRTDAFLTGIF